MSVHPQAGQPVDPSRLLDVNALRTAYTDRALDFSDPGQRVAFGTSGHRGSSLRGSFNEAHVLALAEATRRYRRLQGIDGPLYLGWDTHALSEPAARTTIEVMAAAGVPVVVDAEDRPVPTPVISHAICDHNRQTGRPEADGIVITPSHNPPEDGGFKYNPPHGGPADVNATGWIEAEANRLLASNVRNISREPIDRALPVVERRDLIAGYVDDLASVVDVEAIRASSLRLGVDPLGGATLDVWRAMTERLDLDLELVTEEADPTFGFMRADHDGRIRMDCSSPYAMAGLLEHAGRFDLAFGNDPDGDRHGVVAGGDLMSPNHYLTVAIDYLFGPARSWDGDVAVGKTVVSSSLIDRVAATLGRRLLEVPVGFKWFVPGLLDGSLGFGGEESAGASFLRHDGSAWTTDKDGVVLCLLAAETTARTGRDPAQAYAGLTHRYGTPTFTRVEMPATREQKAALSQLSAAHVTAGELAGEPVTDVLVRAPGNDAPIGGVKVTTESGWFAARPSGTEDVYKVYAESFRGEEHLQAILEEARAVVDKALGAQQG